MGDHKIIRIDTAFPGLQDKELIEALNNGWVIVDKVMGVNDARYVTYIIRSRADSIKE